MEELEWVETLILESNLSGFNLDTIVEVTNTGLYYPTYVYMMAQLGVTGAKEFYNKFGESWHNSVKHDYPSDLNTINMGNDERFMFHNGISNCRPNKGDICCLINMEIEHPMFGSEKIYRLIRINDGREFIMSSNGFKLKQ